MPTVVFIWTNWADQLKRRHVYVEEAETLVADSIKKYFDGCTVKHITVLNEHLTRGEKPGVVVLRQNIERVKRKLEKLNADFCVLIGSAVYKLFCPKLLISVWGGRKVHSDVLNMPVTGVIHPDVVAKLPVKRRDFVVQMRTAAKAAKGGGSFAGSADVQWDYIQDPDEAIKRIDALKSPCVFDFETNGQETTHPDFKIRAVGFCDTPGKAFSIPYESMPSRVRARIKNWCKSSTVKIAHNAKYEVRVCRSSFGAPPKALFWDTMMLHHLLNEDSTHKLESLAYEFTDLGGYDDEMKRLLDQEGYTYANVPVAKLAYYNCGDVDATMRIYLKFRRMLEKDRDHDKLDSFYRRFVRPTWYTLAEMEDNGMYVSEKAYRDLQENTKKRLAEIDDELNAHPKVKRTLDILSEGKKKRVSRFNSKSTKHCVTLLYRVCHEEVQVTTKTGGAATSSEALELMESPLAKLISESRELKHDLSTAHEIFAARRPNGTCATDFYAAGTVTWRLASWNPNLQNLPRNGRVKRLFISRFKNGSIIQGDFSQLEVRILGSLSGDKKYLKALAAGYDFHTYTASNVYKIDMQKISDDQRNKGKRVNFGVIFGIGDKKLAKQTGLDRRDAKKIMDGYFSTYPAVKAWFENKRKLATKDLRVVTVMGQVRRVPLARDADKMIRWHAQRQACNTLIQGVGSALTLYSMNRLSAEFRSLKLRSLVIGQVHDSIIVDCYPGEEQMVANLMHEIMTDEIKLVFSYWLRQPLPVDVKRGKSLGDLKETLKPKAA